MDVTLKQSLGQARGRLSDCNDLAYDNLTSAIADQVLLLLEGMAASEVEDRIGARLYERSEERDGYRNGYRTRTVQLPFTTLRIRIPRMREEGYVPSFLEPGQRAVTAVETWVRKSFLSGLCRSDIIRLMQSTTGLQPSDRVVARVQGQLDAAAKAFKERRLEGKYEYLFLDAAWVKDIVGGQAGRVCVLVALGITSSGERHLLGYERARQETERAWRGFLRRLIERGLDRSLLTLVISDEHQGLINAAGEVLGDVAHQYCWAHRMRNVIKVVDKADVKPIVSDLRAVYRARDLKQANARLYFLYQRWDAKYPQLMKHLRQDMRNLLSFFNRPKLHWIYLRTSNPIERVFVEIRRRRYGCGALANPQACDRLFYGVFERLNRHWQNKDIWYIREQQMKTSTK